MKRVVYVHCDTCRDYVVESCATEQVIHHSTGIVTRRVVCDDCAEANRERSRRQANPERCD